MVQWDAPYSCLDERRLVVSPQSSSCRLGRVAAVLRVSESLSSAALRPHRVSVEGLVLKHFFPVDTNTLRWPDAYKLTNWQFYKGKHENYPLTLGTQHQQSGLHLSWGSPTPSSCLTPLGKPLNPAPLLTEIWQTHDIITKKVFFFCYMLYFHVLSLSSLTFPWRTQRYTDRYCPAAFWNTTLLESRPVVKLVSVELSLSVPVMLLLVPPLSLSELSSSESESEPEILDISPVKMITENHLAVPLFFLLLPVIKTLLCSPAPVFLSNSSIVTGGNPDIFSLKLKRCQSSL